MVNTINSMKWAENYVEEFLKNNEFNPYDVLMGTESKDQKLYGLCVNYLEDVKNAMESLTENFRATREKIVFGLDK